MNMAVNQAGKHGRAAEVDHRRARGNLQAVGGPGVRDPVALNHNHLVRQVRSRLRVEQTASANGDAFRRRRLHREPRGVKRRRLRPGLYLRENPRRISR